ETHGNRRRGDNQDQGRHQRGVRGRGERAYGGGARNEPGNKVYQFCKSKSDPTTYVNMEIYADQAALEAHGKSEHFRTTGPKMGPSMSGRADVQYFDTV